MSRPTFESLSSLIERVAKLEAALKPFAKLSEAYEWRPPGSLLLSSPLGNLTVGDLQRAAEALER